jgi:HEAT repeat protein
MQTNLLLIRIYAMLLAGCFLTVAPLPALAFHWQAAQQEPGTGATPPPAAPPEEPPEKMNAVANPPSRKVSAIPRIQAWQILEDACTGDKTGDRATAVLVLGLIPNDSKSIKLAEKTLTDEKPEVRAAAAAALGNMKARKSISKLKSAVDDQDPSVALAAAHSLDLMHDNSAYEVYYEILNGERKTGKGLIASQSAILHDPKKMAELGFVEGIGFIPFAGIGWSAIKALAKDDSSPVRAAAARVLARDPDQATTKALMEATGDKSWIVQAAALEALAKRGDPSALPTVQKYMSDEKTAIRFTAAAAVIRLTTIKEGRRKKMRAPAPNVRNP